MKAEHRMSKDDFLLEESEEGFTLIEGVTTVAIILVLSASGFLGISGINDHAKETRIKKTANEAVTAVLVSKTSPHMNAAPPTLEEIQQGYNNSNTEIQLEITEDTEQNIIITARGWDDHAVRKVIDREYKVHDRTDELREEDKEQEETPEDSTPQPEFLENPSKVPEGVKSAPTMKVVSRIVAEEVMQRGIMYEEIYTQDLHKSPVGDQWVIALGMNYDGLGFLDNYWGHYLAVTIPHEDKDFFMPYVMVINSYGEAHYLLRDGYQLTKDELRYLSYFDAEPF